MQVRMLCDRVMVECVEEVGNKELASGIILPTTELDKKERRMPTQGLVVAIGPGKLYGETLVPVVISLGARVIFDRYGHEEITCKGFEEGKRYFVMREKDVLAVIE